MRYTKELQKSVCSELDKGATASDCSKKYGIPQDVVVRWGSLDMTEQKAREIALRKYIDEITLAGDKITSDVSEIADEDVSDRKWDDVCTGVQKTLLNLTAEVVKKERNLNPEITAEKTDSQIIDEIVEKWKDNPFLSYYQNIAKNFEGGALQKIRQETCLG